MHSLVHQAMMTNKAEDIRCEESRPQSQQPSQTIDMPAELEAARQRVRRLVKAALEADRQTSSVVNLRLR